MRRGRFIRSNLAVSGGLFLGMLLFIEIGRRLGTAQIARYGAEAHLGSGAAGGPVFALLALLIGFSFNGAAARFDRRRDLIAKEVNAIGTAWQCIDLLPAERQAALRDGFRRYVDGLLASYAESPEIAKGLLEPPAVTHAQRDIWSRSAVAVVDPSGEKARTLLVPALNSMFGAVESERLARRVHPPVMIFLMLALLAFVGSVFSGYSLADSPVRNWIYNIGMAGSIATAVYVIIELEFPRLGVIRVTAMDRALTELRATMS